MSKKIIIFAALFFVALVSFVAVAWAMSYFNNNFYRTARCPQCQENAQYLADAGLWLPQISFDYVDLEPRERKYFTAETTDEMIAQLREILPWLCEDCAYIRAKFHLMSPDDPQWIEYSKKVRELPHNVRVRF